MMKSPSQRRQDAAAVKLLGWSWAVLVLTGSVVAQEPANAPAGPMPGNVPVAPNAVPSEPVMATPAPDNCAASNKGLVISMSWPAMFGSSGTKWMFWPDCDPPFFVPPMMGDMFFGGLRSAGTGGASTTISFLGFGKQALELIPINLTAAAPKASFQSSGSIPPFTSINSAATFTSNTVIALQPGAAFLQRAKTAFPGATLLSSQAVPEALVNRFPGLGDVVRGDNPTQFPGPPVQILVSGTGGGLQITGPFPGARPGQDFTVAPGGAPIVDGTSLYGIFNTFQTPGAGVTIRLPEPGGFSRYTRVSENNSPLPEDRVFFNYNYLDGVMNRAHVNQGTFGVEKTFLNGRASVQVNVPFANTLDDTQFLDSGAASTSTTFGNISIWLKGLLYRDECAAISAGLGINTPTADDVHVFSALGDTLPLLRVNNEAVHLNPFVGAVYADESGYFVQGFGQVDVDPNGNTVYANVNGTGLTRVGHLSSATLLYVSGGAGYTLSLDAINALLPTRITPMVEMHFTTDLGGANMLSAGGVGLTSRTGKLDTLNLVAGTNFAFGNCANLNVGFGVPIIGDSNRQYNWEAVVQLNILFGRPR